MYDNEKVYSIELGEDLALPDRPEKQPAAVSPAKRRRTAAPAAPAPARKPDSKQPADGLQFAPLMILTWLLGPFSVHLHAAQRPGKGLLAVGMISGMAGLGMFAGRGFILDLIAKGWPLWPWALIGVAVMMTAFSVWANTASQACRDQCQPRHKLPAVLRRPWVIGVTGLVAPGLGLLLAGCARRGAAVIWALWPVIGAMLVLAHGLQIWNRNQVAGGTSIPSGILEMSFIASLGLIIAGLIGWVAQALEGARQMMGEPGIRHRMRGDWYAVSLVCALLGMALLWDPAVLARQMGSGAVILQERGFQVIPLQLSRGAHRLDPAPTEYAVRAIGLYEELGQLDQAAELRRELDDHLASYLSLVQTENHAGVRKPHAGRTPVRMDPIMAELLDDQGMSRHRYQAR